jgi:hypothetical protein
MSIVNRRNAMIGWVALKVVRRVAATKAKKVQGALPAKSAGAGSRGKKALKLGAVVVAVAGAAAFWKAKHRDSTDHDSIASEELRSPDR